MKYFFDTEFIEGKQPKKFLGFKYGETKPIVDLISIGVVSEDNREYYAVSNEFNLKHAWSDEWIRENVLFSIYKDYIGGDERNRVQFSLKNMKHLIKLYGKPNKRIASEILIFSTNSEKAFDKWLGSSDAFINELAEGNINKEDYPEFWAYFASTDWVAFYQLWGKMIDAPKPYPFFVKDLKNLMEFNGLTKEWKQENCPDPIGEHNALVDARWNNDLYNTINSHLEKRTAKYQIQDLKYKASVTG